MKTSSPNPLILDVIIPCYNAQMTLARAVESVLNQLIVQRLILVDDASTDDTWQVIQRFAAQYPAKILAVKLHQNSGVAMARNMGIWHSDADLVAFLDADDAYQVAALEQVPTIFSFMPSMSLLRLKLVPHGLMTKYSHHPNFGQAWDMLQMTVGGNMIFRRNILLLCGGFPTDQLFQKMGGEDGALGIALARRTLVGTLFESQYPGVVHYCRAGMHAERLLNAYLFDKQDETIRQADLDFAEAMTQKIVARLDNALPVLMEQNIGRRPLLITYA